MKNSNISIISHESIFDSIRKENEHGKEYWLARELQLLLGYGKWQNFSQTIDKAQVACRNTQNPVSEHFLPMSVKIHKGNRQQNN